MKKLDKLSEQITILEKKENDICDKRDRYRAELEKEEKKISELKTLKNDLKDNLDYISPQKYSELNQKIIDIKRQTFQLKQKFDKYDSKCTQIQNELRQLKIKEIIAKQKLNKIQSQKLEKLLSKEEWVEGEGQDILDIDESLKSCEEKSLKYAEQNAINTKYGIISSFAQSNQEINLNGKKVKINKNFTQNLRNLIKVVKLDEKIIYQKREPITVKGIKTYICKTKVKLKVKGILQKKDLENLSYKPQIKSINKVKNRKLISSKNKEKFSLGNFGGEAYFGYAYSLYKLGKEQSKTDALSTNLGIGIGYFLFKRIFLEVGLGIIADTVKTSFSLNEIQQQSQQGLKEISVETSFYKLGALIFPFSSKEGYFLRGEYLGSSTKVGEEAKINGNGIVIGFGKKKGGMGLEFRYTRSNNEDPHLQNGKVHLEQFSLLLSIMLF